MTDLKQREAKMQEARKNTPRREYIKQLASRSTLIFGKEQGVISRYPRTNRVGKVVTNSHFEKEIDNAQEVEVYDVQTSFFTSLQTLRKNTTLPAFYSFGGNDNAGFVDCVSNTKNAYLSSMVLFDCENVLYSFNVKDNTTNVLNSVMIMKGSNVVYQSFGVRNSYNIFFSKYITNSSDTWFSNNLYNCRECLFCHNLENQSFCIKNQQYTKEEYQQQKQRILHQKDKFDKWYRIVSQSKGVNVNTTNSQGDFLIDCEKISNAYSCTNINGGNNLAFVFSKDPSEEMYDVFAAGRSDNFYAVVTAGQFSSHVYCSIEIQNSSHVFYSFFLTDCSYCLGCIGLKNKQFCIFNKQYTKEERFERSQKIFQKMSDDGELGKFFPPSMNPFYFNDTVAYLIDDSFTKEEVEAEGYLRRDEEIKVDIPEGSEVVYTRRDDGLHRPVLDDYQGFDADGNWHIDPEILKKVIVDEKGNAYRIVKMEYDFLMKYGLPLPELHWLERIKLGFQFG